MARTLQLTFALLLFTARAAACQLGFLDKVFSKVTDVDVFYMRGTPISQLEESGSATSGELRGLGVEVTLDLGDIATLGSRKTDVFSPGIKSSCPTFARKPALKDLRHRNNGSTLVIDSTFDIKDTEPVYSLQDSLWRRLEVSRKVEAYSLNDTVPAGKEILKELASDCSFRPALTTELGFGYSQLSRLRSRPTEVKGTLEELPFVSLYFDAHIARPVVLYGGIRVGLTNLKDFRAIVADSQLVGSGSTYQYGPVVGVALGDVNGVVAFFEYSWTYRRAEAIKWGGAKVALPQDLRDPLNLSTRVWSLGLAIELGDASD